MKRGRITLRLRTRLVLACFALALAPLVASWLMGLYDRIEIHRLEDHLSRIGDRAIEAGKAQSPDDALTAYRALASENALLLEVLDSAGEIVAATDPSYGDGQDSFPGPRAATPRWWRGSADFFFGPGGPPDLLNFEAELGSPAIRPEVIEALRTKSPTTAVRAAESAKMFVVYRAVPRPDGSGALYLLKVSRRSVRALYDFRFQLLKLTIVLAVGGLLIALWLSWSLIQPIRALQSEVRRYLLTGRRGPLVIDRGDELGALSEDLERLAGRLEAKADRTANDASDLAHELKSPIAAVLTAAELLEGDGPLDAERRHRIGQAIAEAATHLSRSVDSMLAIARLEESLGKEERGQVELGALVERTLDALRPIAKSKGLDLEIKLEGPAWMSGHGPRIEELVRNLVDNAIIFGRSKVILSVSAGPPTIVVADDGPGVPASERARIFTRFYSARPEGAPQGTGLGLAIARAIAEAHGGRLELLPGSGGARFAATFPGSE